MCTLLAHGNLIETCRLREVSPSQFLVWNKKRTGVSLSVCVLEYDFSLMLRAWLQFCCKMGGQLSVKPT